MPRKKTREEFVVDAIEVHGDKYCYDYVQYVNSRTKVQIHCPVHGDFLQTPASHLSGTGCPQCSGNAKSSAREFIEKAKQVHGNKYCYDYVQYEGAHKKVQIQCPEHGDFLQEPSNHLSGQGCPQCGALQRAASKTKDQEQFIVEANKKHNNKYCYDSVQYVNSRTKVQIICPAHGDFYQLPSHHLRGVGCPQCYFDSQTKDREQFITEANKKHNNKYSYDHVQYEKGNKKVQIHCPVHGDFLQEPSNHLRGKGCPTCANESKTKDQEQFITEANKKHNNKYSYDKVQYVNAATKVRIHCPVHGVFLQKPRDHFRGAGCPTCANEAQTKNQEQFIVEANKKHNNKYRYDSVQYVNSYTKVQITCLVHGDFSQTPSSHLCGNGCPQCANEQKESKELAVIVNYIAKRFGLNPVIDINNTDIIREQKFDGLRFKKQLKCDIYVPSLNLIIEFDGQQHFHYTPYFNSSKEAFNEAKERDETKNEFLISNGFNLLRIRDLKNYSTEQQLDKYFKHYRKDKQLVMFYNKIQ